MVKLVPIVEVIQIHSVFWRRSVIGDAACAKNPVPRFVVVIVAAHRRVVLLDRFSIYRFPILLHPRLEFGIGRVVLLNVISHRLLLESERGESHRIETFANARIAGSKFTFLLERDLLPKPRQMDNAKWTGNAGTDQWDICIGHSNSFGNPA